MKNSTLPIIIIIACININVLLAEGTKEDSAPANAKEVPGESTQTLDQKDSSLKAAFQQEYSYLHSQKQALERQLAEAQNSKSSAENKARDELSNLELQHMQLASKLEAENDRLVSLQNSSENSADALELLTTTSTQAFDTLQKFKHIISDIPPNNQVSLPVSKNPKNQMESSAKSGLPETQQRSLPETLENLSFAITTATEILHKMGSVRTVADEFFLHDGTKTKGNIIYLGNISAYGISEKYQGALAPAGGGKLKAIKADTRQSASFFEKSGKESQFKAYLFESPHAEAVEQVEKTWLQTIDDGGKVAWVIFYLGVFTTLMTLIRFYILQRSSKSSRSLTKEIGQMVVSGNLNEAMNRCEKQTNLTARVLEKTLANIEKGRNQLEDIVSETVIHESRMLDRFGNFIMVTSTIAPLLGLLGTVAGMIATFTTLTEFGMGNPKLLSGGISEALVCTMMGLIVAIPALLFGSIMNGWAERIKDDMVHAALHITNLFQTQKPQQKMSI